MFVNEANELSSTKRMMKVWRKCHGEGVLIRSRKQTKEVDVKQNRPRPTLGFKMALGVDLKRLPLLFRHDLPSEQ